MSDKIRISVQTLQAQAAEMNALADAYEEIKNRIDNCLSGFEERLEEVAFKDCKEKLSAISSTANECVVSLRNGRDIANTSAETYQNVDAVIRARVNESGDITLTTTDAEGNVSTNTTHVDIPEDSPTSNQNVYMGMDKQNRNGFTFNEDGSLVTSTGKGWTVSQYNNDFTTSSGQLVHKQVACTYLTAHKISNKNLGLPYSEGFNTKFSTVDPNYKYKSAGNGCLDDLIKEYGGAGELDNIVLHFNGHVLLIDKLKQDANGSWTVKWSDNYNWDSNTYLTGDCSKIGEEMTRSLDDFKSLYHKYNGNFTGAVMLGTADNWQ